MEKVGVNKSLRLQYKLSLRESLIPLGQKRKNFLFINSLTNE